MFAQRGNLGFDGFVHDDPHVWLHRHTQPNLFRRVRFQTFCQQFGKIHAIAGGGKDRIQRCRARNPVIGMIDRHICANVCHWVARDDHLRSKAANLANDFAAHIQGIEQLAVGISEKCDFFDADHIGGRALLGAAVRTQHFGRHLGVVASLVAASQQEIVNLFTLARPFGKGRAAKKFRIVGMRENDQDTL